MCCVVRTRPYALCPGQLFGFAMPYVHTPSEWPDGYLQTEESDAQHERKQDAILVAFAPAARLIDQEHSRCEDNLANHLHWLPPVESWPVVGVEKRERGDGGRFLTY